MSAIPPLSRDQQTSSERAKNDAIDPKLTNWVVVTTGVQLVRSGS